MRDILLLILADALFLPVTFIVAVAEIGWTLGRVNRLKIEHYKLYELGRLHLRSAAQKKPYGGYITTSSGNIKVKQFTGATGLRHARG